MSTKKLEELKSMSLDDLQNNLVNAKAEFKKLKMDHALSGLENPLVIREARRNVARVNTELRSREIAEMTPEQLNKRSKIRSRRSKK